MANNFLNWQFTQVQSYQPLKVKHSTVILAFVALMFLGDAMNATLLRLGVPFWRVSILVRSLALLYFVFLLIRKPRSWRLLRIVLVLLIFFFLGAIFWYVNYEHYNWFENTNIFIKMIFFFISWQVFRLYFKSNNERAWLFKIFEFLILIQAFSIIIAFIFDLEIFQSYSSFKRFGYKGFIPARNELSGFFTIAFFYFIWKVTILDKGTIPLLLILIASLLTGAKVAISFPIILALFVAYWSLVHQKKRSYLYAIFLFFAFLALVIWRRNYILELITPTLNYFRQQLAYGNNPNIFSIFFSGRDLLVMKLLEGFLSRINIITLLFGGYELSILSSETDFIDVFLFIGLVGAFIFYIVYIKTLFYCEKKRNFTQYVFVFSWLGISILAGHLVFSAINGPYLAILLLAFSWLEYSKTGISQKGSSF